MNYCPKCGAKINEKARFCISCGTNFEGNMVSTQGLTPTIQSPRKLNNTIIALIAIIIAVIIVVVVVVVLFSSNSKPGVTYSPYDAEKFSGYTFRGTYLGQSTDFQFNLDNSFILWYGLSSSGSHGTWGVSEGVLYIYLTDETRSFHYAFSNEDYTLTLTPITPSGDQFILVRTD